MDLLILGASARAAAFSALRIGLRPICVDLFADADLAASCQAHRVDPGTYPEALATIAADLPPLPWLYTGALENRPDLVDRISERHRLLGNPGATLRVARDPLALAEAATDAGLVAPEIQIDPAGLPIDGSWLRKPLASAGGRGIVPWLGQDVRRRPGYYQRRVDGLPASAVFVGGRTGARCLGVTRQFVGNGSNRFAYRGSLAPWPVGDDVRAQVERLGNAVARRFGLVGLFGLDLILEEGTAWPIELNPRYSASVEVLEWSLGRSLLAEHLRAAGSEVPTQGREVVPARFAAKAVVFAGRTFCWPSDEPVGPFDPARFPEVADVPRSGTEFRPGDPVLTAFARGDSPTECRRELAERIRRWRRWIRERPDVHLGSDQRPGR